MQTLSPETSPHSSLTDHACHIEFRLYGSGRGFHWTLWWSCSCGGRSHHGMLVDRLGWLTYQNAVSRAVASIREVRAISRGNG